MQVSLLGPVRVRADDGTPIDIGGARLRMLLARLALAAGRPVAADTLVDGLWGALSPAGTANALQSLVSRLRKTLGDPARLTSTSAGYVLDVESVDADRFEELAARGRRELTAGHPAQAATLLREALALWHGEALSDVRDAPFAQAPAVRLEELRVAAVEDRFDAELALGRHADVLADLDAAGAAHPLRERLAGLRMRALSVAGRQSEALAVFERTRAILADELGVDPSAQLRQVHVDVLRGEVAAPNPKADHLPVWLTSFVGRSEELDQLAHALERERLVTLVGPGGAGKTRLATEAAARHPAHQRRRVWLVALGGVTNPADVTGAVIGALGPLDRRLINSSPSRQAGDAVGSITDLLGGGAALLVLDNCEHLIGAAAELAHELLARLPGLRVLATSREPLAITGELLCQLGPLAAPAAMRLFTERAAIVRPGFTLDDATREPVAEICRRLDGMPLALELAAARLRSMSVERIAERLDDRFRLLTSGSRVALPRQRTLRAVVEWSWDLLAKPELVLARRLAVFPGGVTVAAAEAVCADESLGADDIVYVLGSLVEKSIVDIQDDRYRMLETIRAYGDERLDEAGERDAVTRRFAGYYLDVAHAADAMLRSADQLRAIGTFEAEHDNIVAALRQAIDDDDAGTAWRLVRALTWYWVIRGSPDEPRKFTWEVLRFQERIPDHVHAALRAAYALIDMRPYQGRLAELRTIVDDCARTGAAEHYPPLALATPMLAFLIRDHDLVEREVRRGLAHADPWARACTHWVEAFVLDDAGNLDEGDRARDAAMAGFQAVGDRWGVAMTLVMHAGGHSLRGDHERAISLYQQGLAMAEELASIDDMVQQLCQLATERLRAGDPDGARRELERADRLAERGDPDRCRALVHVGLAELARRTGDFATAKAELDWLRPRVHEFPLPPGMAAGWIGMCTVALLVTEGKAEQAREMLPEVLLPASERQDMPDVARAVTVAAYVFALESKPELAALALGAAKAIRGVVDAGDPELAALAVSLTERLTAQTYQAAYDRGAALGKAEAVERILAEFS